MPLLGTLALLPLSLSRSVSHRHALFLFRNCFFCFFLYKWNQNISITFSLQISTQKKTLISDSSRFLSDSLTNTLTLKHSSWAAWLLLLLSTQMESEDLHHCFCTNFYSKEIADFHQPQIRERSPVTRHSPWKRGWHTVTKKVRSSGDTSCFAKCTLFLWRRVITNRDTFVVSSRKEEEPQIRHQIQIRVGFFRFTISELHFIFNSHLFPSQFDLRVRTQQLDW